MNESVQRFLDGWQSLERWQRSVLIVLGSIVAVMAVVAITVGGDGDEREATETTLAASASTTTTSPTTSTTAPTTTIAPDTTTTSSTTTSTSTTTTTTTTTLPPESILTLRPDGLGDVLFGDDAADSLIVLVDVLGSPTDDSGWIDQPQGTCIGTEIRFVTWGSLRVFFTNGPSDWAPADVRHVASYDHSANIGLPVLELRTAEGVGIGTSVGDVRAIYGDDAVIVGDPLYGDLFQVLSSGAGVMWGLLSGPEATDTVVSVSGGFACGE